LAAEKRLPFCMVIVLNKKGKKVIFFIKNFHLVGIVYTTLSVGSWLHKAQTDKIMDRSVIKILITCLAGLFFFQTAEAATYTVTTLGSNSVSPVVSGSLRWAIQQANANPGLDIIDFNVASMGVISENGAGADINNSMTITEEVVIDATINNMATAWTTNGACGPILSITFNYDAGLIVNAPNVTIRGLAFRGGGFKILYSGVSVTSGAVQGCYFGLSPAGIATVGTVPSGAVTINSNASGVVVGGNTCATRNVFVCQNDGGVVINGASNNTVVGNYFNTNAAGAAFVSPGSAQACIRFRNSALNNTIDNNLICINNAQAVMIESGSNQTHITNNKINTALTGNAVMPASGAVKSIDIDGSANGVIEDNIITIAGTHAIHLRGTPASSGWTIRGNRIGIGADGVTRIVYATNGYGIYTQSGATSLVIENNYLGTNSGNTEHGIHAEGPGITGATNTITLRNNVVGMQASGVAVATDYGFRKNGVFIKDFREAIIENNIISDNGNGLDATFSNGLQLENVATFQLVNNKIGVDVTGNVVKGNNKNGIQVQTRATNFLIQGNIIGGNGFMGGVVWPNIHHGIQFIPGGTYTTGTITGNYVGRSPSGVNIANGNMGIGIWSLTNSTISNNVSANNKFGLFFDNCDGNTITGNTFEANDDAAATNREAAGILFQSGCDNNQILNNTVRYNKTGIWLRGDPGGNNTGNTLLRNQVTYNGYATDGTTASLNGTRNAIENAGQGISVGGSSSNNRIGSAASLADANTVAFNRGQGVLVNSSNQVAIRKNSIHCNGSTPAERATPNFAIRLLGGGNIGITPPGPLTYPPIMTAATGITVDNVPDGDIAGTDVVEVYFDDGCGCQLRDYKGDATNRAANGDWSFAGGALPGTAFGTPGSPLPNGSGVYPPSGLASTTATRTDVNGNTSEPMDCVPIQLPVDLLSYSAKRYGKNSSIITWVTTDEKNNAYFQLLRSTDGKNFRPIANIEGAGNSNTTESYSYIDENLEGVVYYYLLLQVDFDGKEHNKGVVRVTFDEEVNIEVVPTLLQQGTPLRILNLSGTEIIQLSIVDLNGKTVYQNGQLAETENDIATGQLTSGLYIVRIYTATQVITKKIVVQ
jgi:parallel beta-helix repeat protein